MSMNSKLVFKEVQGEWLVQIWTYDKGWCAECSWQGPGFRRSIMFFEKPEKTQDDILNMCRAKMEERRQQEETAVEA